MRGRISSVLALAALFGAIAWTAPGPVVENGALMLNGRRLVVRGAGYRQVAGKPCLLARDLPLIAGMGANTVRTPAPAASDERYFLAVLASTRLYWLAEFPLEEYSGRESTLADFQAYVERFRGRARVLAFVFGNSSRFPGSHDEFDRLVAGAAEILKVTGSTALLTTTVEDADEMDRDIPGLDFWTWDVRGPALPAPQGARSRPVLIGSFRAGDDAARAAAEFAAKIDRPNLLGGLWTRPASGPPGLDRLLPRVVYSKLAALWGGTYPAGWSEAEAPEFSHVENETNASAGSVVRITGTRLMAGTAPYADTSWPFTLGGACVCVEDVPARIGYVSPTSLTVQLPAGLEPGERGVRLYRAGVASNVLPLRIRLSADTSSGPILEVD